MKFFIKTILLIIILILPTSIGSPRRIDYRRGMSNNVCKKLKGDVLVYFVFVDSKLTSPWTEYDIRSTLDSMSVAINWIKQQARLKNIDLNIRSDYFIGNEFTPVKKNLPEGTVIASAETPNLKKGLYELNRWADGIASRIGKEMDISSKDGIPEIKNPRNKERLVAHLRDEHQLESVALLFLVNNYFKSDESMVINNMHSNDVEFGIVSYKYPAVIAQNILSLFGASCLNNNIYRKNDKKIRMAGEYFPDDIMQDVYARDIQTLNIGEFTEYLIGWTEHLDPKFQSLLTDRIVTF